MFSIHQLYVQWNNNTLFSLKMYLGGFLGICLLAWTLWIIGKPSDSLSSPLACEEREGLREWESSSEISVSIVKWDDNHLYGLIFKVAATLLSLSDDIYKFKGIEII